MSEKIQNSTPAADERLRSIDALRGFDMFWIAGGDTLATLLLKRWNSPTSEQLRLQFEHVEWEGFRFYDLIFPLFMFLVGCVIPFSLEKYRDRPTAVYGRVLRRTATLFLLGLIANGLLTFQFADLRYAGVLQRIAICYGLASLVFLNLRWKGQMVAIGAILLGYWAVLSFVPAQGGTAGDLSKSGNLSGYLDRTLLPGKILKQYYGDGDNEGLLSTIPAIATVLLGALAGQWLRSNRSGWTKAGGLLVAGVVGIAVGTVWGWKFPIIKNLWTSSFVLLTAGWSLILLSFFYVIIDVMKVRGWAFLWIVIGMNAITIYVAPRLIEFEKPAAFLLSGCIELAGDWGAVLLQFGELTCKWLFLYMLYRNRVFLRL
ncbi:MAG: acyltransferase family protein [Planctomycetota bacterium]